MKSKHLLFAALAVAIMCASVAVAGVQVTPEAMPLAFEQGMFDPGVGAIVAAGMTKKLRELLGKKEAAAKGAKAILDKAETENRDLTEDESKAVAKHVADIKSLDTQIDTEKTVAEALRSMQPANPAARSAARVYENLAEDPRGGFRSYGHFARDVMLAGQRGGRVSDQLGAWNDAMRAAAPATYGNESSGADGGFLVPPEYAREVWQLSLAEDALIPLTDEYPVQGNSLVFPSDETTPWGTDGMRAYWESEAETATGTKPKLTGPSTLRLSKLMALVPVTDELLADAGALERWIGRKSAESIRWKTNLALFQGDGIGKPTGMFGHACQISVAKEAGQAADTVNATNVAKMFARCLGVTSAVWMINPDVLPQLIVMTISNQPIWTPPVEGMKQAPMGMLLGRPIMTTQLGKTVGDKGDLTLANWKYYRSITKAGAGIETATSMHLYFDAGLTAFRATYRVDGRPALKAAVSPANGANTLSPFVTLDDRA